VFVKKGNSPGGKATLGVAGKKRREVVRVVEIQSEARARDQVEAASLALGLLAMGLGAADPKARGKGAREG
jgi:hypothetical protein